jgi:hypothetical protein
MASIRFNGVEIQKQLDVFAKTQVPFVAAVTVNRLAAQAKKDIRADMQRTFNTVATYTLNSVQSSHFATKREPWTEIYLLDFAGKGNAAANYLLPQIIGGSVYPTRFQRRIGRDLTGYNGAYMLPLHDSAGTKVGRNGRMRPSQYVEALYGLRAMESFRASVRPGRYRTEGSYTYMPYLKGTSRGLDTRGGSRRRKSEIPKPGIYRRVGGTSVRVFAQLRSIPTVPPKFSLIDAANSSVAANAERIFGLALEQYKL